MNDPWVITSREKVKYCEQFKSLNPVNGVVTGGQAKGFFLQSQLPPPILGQIWGLADTDSDGKMNLDEFSIACKLINLKLRSFELPKSLPPTLLSSLSTMGVTPTRTPTGGMSPMDPMQHHVNLNRPAIPPLPQAHLQRSAVPPMIPPQPLMGSLIGNAVPLIPAVPIIPMQPLISTAVPSHQSPLIPGMGGGMMPINQLIDTSSFMPLTDNIVLPAGPTPPQSGTPSRSMSISERAPSIESPSGGVEWAIKGPVKLKYTQLFNTTDKHHTGYLTGVQARSLMIQSKLPQQALAQIWNLSDMDSDGRLGCDEFVLAMYLCELAQQGGKIPVKLPLELVPPIFRKPIVSRHGSVSGISRHGSVSSQGGMVTGIPTSSSIDLDPLAGMSQTTFEDKRKENFDKGQAELERRRKALLDIQRKEKEERERKEREEYEKQEKARLEAENRKQQELDRQLQRQRELEQEKEEQRIRALEQKDAARKEMERQRQLEWEKQKIAELQQQKEREQEKVIKLKGHNQNLNIELSTLNEKIKELSQKICDTRGGVTNVKTVIDGMRSTRDIQNSELTQMKTQIKEQNHKLVQLSQEKAKLDARAKTNQLADSVNKEIALKQLKDKIETQKQEIGIKSQDIKTNDDMLESLKNEVKVLVNSCEEIYTVYDVERNKVIEMKNNRKPTDGFGDAWGETNNKSAWPVEAVSPVKIVESAFTVPTSNTAAVSNVASGGVAASSATHIKYRALYEFFGRNEDEISFQPGDIIMVPSDLKMEPGWLAGEVNGLSGYFPETYVEKMESPTAEENTFEADFSSQNNFDDVVVVDNTKRSLEGIAETIESTSTAITTEATNGNLEYYMSCYPYESTEIGDLIFSVGELVLVTKKDGDWWTGKIGTRTGMFPSNYVQPTTETLAAAAIVTKPTAVEEVITKTPTSTNFASFNDSAFSEMVPEAKITNGNIPQMASPPMSNSTTPTNNINKEIVMQTEAAVIISPQSTMTEDAKNQIEADSEVSEINTQPIINNINDIPAGYTSRPMSTTSTTRMKKSDIAQVIAPYEATSTEQLSLQRGQLIMIRKKTDSGWWEGELQAKGKRRQIGWFPATYVKVLQGGRNSGRNTPVSGGRIEMSEQVLDKVISLYPYKALNDDELSFEKDDIISVLGRDEPEWWRGELNGITGLFPSNYVGPLVSSGMV